MAEPASNQNAQPPKRYRFGLRWLLVLLLVLCVALAWFGRESRRVRREIRLTGELAQLDVRLSGREPTGIDFVARKLLGLNRDWLREHVHESWLGLPHIATTWTATDEQIPEIAQRIKQLPTIHELHVRSAPISESGLARLKRELPHVAVLTQTDLAADPNRGRPRAHFAAAAVEFVAISVLVVLAVAIALVWPYFFGRAEEGLPQGACDGANRKVGRSM